MSVPIQYDGALLKYSLAAAPTVFTALCGLINVKINRTADIQSKRVRDCLTPMLPGADVLKNLGNSYTISADGLTNASIQTIVSSSLFGKKIVYKIEGLANDDTAGGLLLGTWTGTMIMENDNKSIAMEGDSSQEYSFKGQGDLVYVANP